MEGIRLAVLLFVLLLQMQVPQTHERIVEEKTSFFANNERKMTKMESTHDNQDRSKNWRKKDQAGAEDLTDIRKLGEKNHPKEKTFEANNMDIWTKNTKTTTNSKSNIVEDLLNFLMTNDDGGKPNSHKTLRQRQQESNMTQVRSSRQRRTVQTPETKLVCQEELSCRNKCQNPRKVSYQAQLSCFCDEDCEFFKDCCADYDDFCGTNGQNVTNTFTTQNTSSIEHLVSQENRDLWRCYLVDDLIEGIAVWMIGSCPRSWPEDDVFYRCRNLSEAFLLTKDAYRYPPVYTSNGRVYHNRFCAQCNGVSPKDLGSFTEFSIECDFTPPRHLSTENTISYLFSYCPYLYTYWLPRKGDPRRYCYPIVDWCVNQIAQLIQKCLSGKPRIVSGQYYFYRNTECAKCHNESSISCGPNITKYTRNPSTAPNTFSVIFDWNVGDTKGLSLVQIETPCPDDRVYDHYLDICTGHIPALPILTDYYEYRVVLRLKPYVILSSLAVDVYQQAIAQELAVPVEQVTNIEIRKNISFTLRIRKNESLHSNVRNILDFTSPFNITIDGDLYTVFKANKRTLTCANLQKYDRSEYTVTRGGTSAVSFKKTGEVLQYTEYYINTTEASTSASDSQAIFVCRQHQISNCSGVYILMNEGEFRVLMNKSIFVNASKQVYEQPEYIWQDKRVLVCEKFSTAFYKEVSNDDPLLTTITIVCMSLSIIGLVFVLVTYSLFSELRTIPGTNLMNLSVSILLSQLMWIVGSGQTDSPIGCTVIAVILHYLFLVSFMWTSIIASDTCRALSLENQVFPYPEIQIVRRIAVGWFGTLIYESICVILGLTDSVNTETENMVACWITDKWALLYFFGAPVFLLLVFNMVFCVMTVRATAQAGVSPDPNTKKNFGIYVRIASLMGFTWIFGFAAPFGWQFLWYPFVVLNGLQGVCIALAFAFNKKARDLYKRLILKSPPPSTEASDISVPRTKAHGTECSRNSMDTKL